MKHDFDKMLMRLFHEKAHMDISMVTADIKHITQYEEMTLLKEFEKRETTFTSRFETKKEEKGAMAIKVRYIVSQLDSSSVGSKNLCLLDFRGPR